jgi:phosphogluconate dehydratase
VGGPIAKVQNGDLLTLNANEGLLQLHVSEQALAARSLATAPRGHQQGVGRELFSGFRATVGSADTGASVFTGLDQGVVANDE